MPPGREGDGRLLPGTNRVYARQAAVNVLMIYGDRHACADELKVSQTATIDNDTIFRQSVLAAGFGRTIGKVLRVAPLAALPRQGATNRIQGCRCQVPRRPQQCEVDDGGEFFL